MTSRPLRRRAVYHITICALLPLSVIGGCGMRSPEHTFSQLKIANGLLELRYVEMLGAAPFAAHTVRFYYVEDKHEQLLAEAQLKNDGKNPKSHNVDYTENDDGTVLITLRGEEQLDSHWSVSTIEGVVTIRMRDL